MFAAQRTSFDLAAEAVLCVYADSDYPLLASALARTISVASSVLKFYLKWTLWHTRLWRLGAHYADGVAMILYDLVQAK